MQGPDQRYDTSTKTGATDADGGAHALVIYFKNAVHSSKPAQEYLRSRALDAGKLEIGYNTGQFHHGTRRDEGLIESCMEVGLLSKHDRPGRTGEDAYRPFAKYCLVFALRNKVNQVSGLYFRSTLNDQEQRHFYLKDRQGLYPRYPAVDTKRLILTESIIDAATLLQLPAITEQYSVLALYGTNVFTDEHEAAIRELTQLEELIFWLNADEPGAEATKKHAATLQALYPGITITQVYMPAGEDVNSLAQGHSDPGIFSSVLEQSQAPGMEGAKLFLSPESSGPDGGRPFFLVSGAGGCTGDLHRAGPLFFPAVPVLTVSPGWLLTSPASE